MNEQEAWTQRLKQLNDEIPSLFTLKGTALYIGATPLRFQMGRELYEAGYRVTLLEAFPQYAQFYEGHPWLEEVICGDVGEIRNLASGRKWDLTVWWHGPEHIQKDRLSAVLRDLETVTKRLVVLGSPWGTNRQGMTGGNPFSAHRTSLDALDFQNLGYETRTLGRKDDPATWCHVLAWKYPSDIAGSLVVYSAVFGQRDDLQPALHRDVQHICFTDDPHLVVDGWESRLVTDKNDPLETARFCKALPGHFLGSETTTIWHDAHGTLKIHPGELTAYLRNSPLALFIHPERDCLYREAEAVIDLKKADPVKVLQQSIKYALEGYPARNGLAATGLVVRKGNDVVRRLDEMWWSEMRQHTMRDQLSLDYVCWKLKVKYEIIPGNLWQNDIIAWQGHK